MEQELVLKKFLHICWLAAVTEKQAKGRTSLFRRIQQELAVFVKASVDPLQALDGYLPEIIYLRIGNGNTQTAFSLLVVASLSLLGWS
jgi:hypothetical protein